MLEKTPDQDAEILVPGDGHVGWVRVKASSKTNCILAAHNPGVKRDSYQEAIEPAQLPRWK